MIFQPESNPYKKLLEANKNEEYYKNLMKSIADFFEKERESANEYVTDPYYIEGRYSEDLCLKWINYKELIDIDSLHLKYDYIKENYKFSEIVDEFIKENIRDDYEDEKTPLDDYLEFIPRGERDDYYELGSFLPGRDEDQRDYDSYTEIDVDGESRYLFEVIREIPIKYINKYFNEFLRYSDVELDQLLEIKKDRNQRYFSVYYSDVGDDYASYPVGIKKETFEEYFNEFLNEKGYNRYKSDDNAVWEEEEEE